MITLLSYFKNYKLRLFFTVIIKILGTFSELAVPYILSYVLDDIIPGIEEKYISTGTRDITPILLYGGLMVLFALLFVLLNITANRMASKTTSLIIEAERNKLYKATLNLKLKDLDSITIPSLVSRLSSDTYNLNQALNNIQRLGVRSPMIFLGGIVICSIMSVKLTIVFYILAPIVLLLITIISRIGIRFFTKIQESSDSLVRIVRENITGARVIKALAKEDYERGRYNRLNKDVMKYELKAGYNIALLNPIVNYILDLGLTFSILFGAYQVKAGSLEVGKIIAFISYFTIISGSMVSLARIFETASKGYASAVRIKYVLSIDSSRDIIEDNRVSNYISFTDVSFSYNQNNEYAIKNISFSLEEGESLGILGSTGSGKSTILNLLMGFYENYSGDIFINHKNIKTQTLKEITESFSSVLQTDILFNDTIRENIAFNKKISDEEIDEILKDADAYNFVHSYKEALDHVISAKGNDLSGGQKQRLLISRALINKAPILLLDDSSSALDYKTDSKIRKSLNKYNLTTIIVAQRISSIMHCNKILVIDDGNVIGYGSHDDLLKSCNEYKFIYNIQMGDDSNG